MKCTLLFFGTLADVVATHKRIVDDKQIVDTRSLQVFLTNQYPELKKHNYLIAVNQIVSKDNIQITTGDEIALLPPFAGG